MKKTINIVLNGILFCVEEDAYKKLNDYIDSIRKKYAKEKGGDEIVLDIESSISEKFIAKIKGTKKTISINDVNDLIEVMGTVDDFAEIDEEDVEKKKEKETEVETEERERVRKKLYRNPDDMILGGVASGIAEHFAIDPTIVRVIFILLMIFGGSGFWIYIILWLVMPLAQTNAQKLEMRGNPVTLAKLEQVAKSIKKKAPKEKTWRKIIEFPFNLLKTIIGFFKRIFRAISPVFWKLISFPLLVCSFFGILATGFVAALLIFNPDSAYFGYDFSVRDAIGIWQYNTEIFTGALIIIIPLFLLFLLGIVIWRGKNVFTVFSTSAMLIVWMLSVIIFGVNAVKVAPTVENVYRESEQHSQVERIFDNKNFRNVQINFFGNVEIKEGEAFVIKASGRDKTVDRLSFDQEGDTLKISKIDRKGLCLFCADGNVNIIIEMPVLAEVSSGEMSKVNVRNFNGSNLKIRAKEHSKIDLKGEYDKMEVVASEASKVELSGSALVLNLDVSEISKVEISRFEVEKIEGSVSEFSKIYFDQKKESKFSRKVEIFLILKEGGKFYAEEADAQIIDLKMTELAKAELSGEAGELRIECNENSHVDAFKLDAQKVYARADKHSSIEVRSDGEMELTSIEDSEIIYKGEAEITKERKESGQIRRFGN